MANSSGGSRWTIRRYYAYRATVSNGFFLPVGVLYLQHRGLSLGAIGLVQGAFMLAKVAAEIPTGYVGDRIGRRASLVVASTLSAGLMVAFVVAGTTVEYLGVYVVWAVAWTFRSGTLDAWLYELLSADFDESEFARITGRGKTVSAVTSAVTAVLAGLLVTVDWSIPFLANAGLTALGVPVLLTFAAGDEGTEDGDPFGVGEAVRTLRVQARRPSIRWFVAYAALFSALFAATRTFEQPAATAVGLPVPALGALYAGFKLLTAGAAATTGWFEDRLGARGVFGLLAPVVGVAYLAAATVPVLVVPVLFLARGCNTVTRPVRNQYVNDRFDGAGRATVLSGVSMVLALAGGGARILVGEVAGVTGPVLALSVVGVAATLAAGTLWVTTSPVRSPGGRRGADPGPGVPGD